MSTTTPLEDRLAEVLFDIGTVVFNPRFTDRYGHREQINEALREYNEKRKEQQ